jgi:hypothetical protein
VGHGGEMTQALYAHMNNKKIKIKKNIWANWSSLYSFDLITSSATS